jgi:quercetin dioxygenase-like cupin family protein
MAISHAQPGEKIDVRPLATTLPAARTTTLVKTDRFETIRLVVHAGKEIPTHAAPGELVVQCLEGEVVFTAMGKTQELKAGDMVYLNAKEPHALRAHTDASLLVLILKS